MRVTSVQYARALYEATKDKKHQEIDKLILNFVKTLAGSNQLRLENNIIEKFSEIYNQENNIIEAEVTSCEKLSSQLADKLVHFIKKKYSAEEVVIHNKIDASIGGGIIIRIGDEIIDASVKRQITELKTILVKS